MASHKFAKVLLVLILIAIIPAVIVQGEDKTPRIIDPRYSVPIVVHPGEDFNITLKDVEGCNVVSISIVGFNKTYILSIVGSTSVDSVLYVKVTTPYNASSGLYDLYVNLTSNDKYIVLREPRSVWVINNSISNLTILQYTDIHIGIHSDNVWTHEYYYTAILLANMLDADLVVVTGDNVDVGNDISSLKLYQVLTNMIRKPTFITPGNHDHAGVDTIKAFEEKYYGLYVGPRYWYRVIDNFLLIGLDTGLFGYIDKTQLAWLEEVLREHKDKVKIIAMHHPLFGYDARGYIKGSYEDIDNLIPLLYSSWREHLDSAREFLRLIETYDVRLVLSGHIHTDRVVVYNNKTYFIATTTTCAGRRESDYRGFRIISIDSKGNVRIHTLPGADLFKGMSSYNIEVFSTSIAWSNDYSYYIVYFYEGPNGWFKISRPRIYLYANNSITVKLYGWNNTSVEYKVYDYNGLRVYEVFLPSIKPGTRMNIAIANSYDNKPPTIKSVLAPSKAVIGRPVTLTISVADEGWGVKDVYVEYVYGGKAYRGKAFFNGRFWTCIIPPLYGDVKNVNITIIAIDYAGNNASKSIVLTYYKPAKPTTSKTATATTTTTETGATTQQTTRIENVNTTSKSITTSISTTISGYTRTKTTTSTITSTVEKEYLETSSTTTAKITGTGNYTLIIVLVVAVAIGLAVILWTIRSR